MVVKGVRFAKILRYSLITGVASIVGVFISVQRHDSSVSHSVLLDSIQTKAASADTPDSGTGSGDSGTSDSGSSDSGSSDCGSGGCGDSSDSGSGDSGSGDSGSGDSGDGCG